MFRCYEIVELEQVVFRRQTSRCKATKNVMCPGNMTVLYLHPYPYSIYLTYHYVTNVHLKNVDTSLREKDTVTSAVHIFLTFKPILPLKMIQN